MAFIRGKGKNNSKIGLQDLYKSYKQSVSNPVSYKIYAAFIKEYNERIVNAIIYESLEYKLPFKLGSIRLQKVRYTPFVKDGVVKKDHLRVDWKKTLDLWKELYPEKTPEEIKAIPDKKILFHLNEHTNGFSVRFYWDKRSSNIKNQASFWFKSTRTAKENLASFLKKVKVIEYFK